jgi:excisionase family DNA binding protein
VSHNVSSPSADSDDGWMTITEAVRYTKISRATLYRLMKQGIVPFYRVTGTSQRRFKRSDLDTLMVREEPDQLGDEHEIDAEDS